MAAESSRISTFSKRRSGLFKKASELCTLTGAEVAIIVFSLRGKAFSFGHSSVDAVIGRFLINNPHSVTGAASNILVTHRNTIIDNLNLELAQVNSKLEVAKKHGEMLNQRKKYNHTQYLWESSIDTLQLNELDQLKASFLASKMNVEKEAAKFM